MGIKPPFFTMGFLVLGLSPKYGLEPLMHERKWSGFKRLEKMGMAPQAGLIVIAINYK